MNLFSRRKPFAAALAALCVVGITGCGGGGGGAQTSTDAGLIAFEVSGSIAVVKPDGTGQRTVVAANPTPVNEATASSSLPALSPDGSRIAYVESFNYRQGFELSQILIVVPTGGGAGTSVSFPNFNSLVLRIGRPAWDANGKSLVVPLSDTVGNSGIYRVKTDGTGLTRLIALSPLDAQSSFPSVSDDGNQIVFVNDSNNAHDLYLMNADGSNLHPVPNHIQGFSPDFAPNGTIFFSFSNSSSFSQTFRVQPDGTGLQQLTKTNENAGAFTPALSPDGSRFVAVTTATTEAVGPALLIFNSDGTQRRILVTGPVGNPSWSRSR